MPRGAHFKKENPRINQVSFKVNDSELQQLNELAKQAGVPVAQWLRNCITSDVEIKVETPQEIKEEVKPIEAPTPKVEKVTKASKKPKDYGNDSKNEQMSLF